ncbi:MAG: DNA polymerase III subunit [Sedimentisphaerales bacterium]|jgi:DNA polymerase-3 subunit delta'
MSFKEIFCQDRAIDVLQRAFGLDRWAHAYIFGGPEGVGKFKTAREWAKLLLCKKPGVEEEIAESCGQCESCRLFEAGSHPDFNHVHKELLEFTENGKGKTTPVDLPIDVIREFLVAKVSRRPTLSQRKVFVVSEGEKLNAASQNCLLKVLEEPPAYCCIVLLCTRLEQLLPTTRSRCQIVPFGPVEEERIIEKLRDMGLEKNQAQYFARLAEGSLGAACQWAELELADANLYKTKTWLVDSLARYEYADALNLAEQILVESKRIGGIWVGMDKATSKTDINRKALRTAVRIIISVFRDIMRRSTTPGTEIVNFDQQKQIESLADRLDAEQAAERICEGYRMLGWIDSSVNEKLICEQFLLSMVGFDRIRVSQ